VNPISSDDVEDLFGLRLIIAPACAAGAARADDAAVRSLDQFHKAIESGIEEAVFLEYDRAFHGALADLAGNARLASVEHSLIEELDRLVMIGLGGFRAAEVPEVVAEHNAIIGDPDA
jgi:GntR family transcriptional regulator, rspAB operon transcriptional repressor